MLKAKRSSGRTEGMQGEPDAWLPRRSVRQEAAAQESSARASAASDRTETTKPRLATTTAKAALPDAGPSDTLGDYRNLADSIAEMRRQRRLAREGADTTAAPASAPREGLGWLDRVRDNVDRRRAERTGRAPEPAADTPPASDRREMARLAAMVEALQERVTRLEEENAALARSGRLAERPQLRLAPPTATGAAKLGTMPPPEGETLADRLRRRSASPSPSGIASAVETASDPA